LIGGWRIASVTSSPSSRTRPERKAMSSDAGSRPVASATDRYMAPLSRYVNPSASATARATVDFPAPAGPSMATTTYLHRLGGDRGREVHGDRKSTRLNSSHVASSYAVFCL